MLVQRSNRVQRGSVRVQCSSVGCMQRSSVRVQRSSVGIVRCPAVKAGPSSNLGSAPQGGFSPLSARAMRKRREASANGDG